MKRHKSQERFGMEINMKHNEDLSGFQKTIGYEFKDEGYLKNALTHSSFANEKKSGKFKNNERLEFLGDAVLELTSSEFLFMQNSDMKEGELTKLRASMVCEPALAFCAREIKLNEYIMLGKGEDLTGGRDRDSIVSDALEALIGAIYLDGGFASAKEFISKFILNDSENKKLFFDSKTILQEIVQAESGEVDYTLISESGPDHCKIFEVAVLINKIVMEKGTGRTKKAAEQQAAYNTIIKIRKK